MQELIEAVKVILKAFFAPYYVFIPNPDSGSWTATFVSMGYLALLGVLFFMAIPAWMERETRRFTLRLIMNPNGQIEIAVKRWLTFENRTTVNYQLTFPRSLGDRGITSLSVGRSHANTIDRWHGRRFNLQMSDGCFLMMVDVAGCRQLLTFTSFSDSLGRLPSLTATRMNGPDSRIAGCWLTVSRTVDQAGAGTIAFTTSGGRFVWQGAEAAGLDTMASLLEPFWFPIVDHLAGERDEQAKAARDRWSEILFAQRELAKAGKPEGLLGHLTALVNGDEAAARETRAMLERGDVDMARRRAPVPKPSGTKRAAATSEPAATSGSAK